MLRLSPRAPLFPYTTLFRSEDAIQQAASLIAAAERPLMMIGRGVIISGAYAEVRELAERTGMPVRSDRKSTRLNSSHTVISYAVFCLKKKKTEQDAIRSSIQ